MSYKLEIAAYTAGNRLQTIKVYDVWRTSVREANERVFWTDFAEVNPGLGIAFIASLKLSTIGFQSWGATIDAEEAKSYMVASK